MASSEYKVSQSSHEMGRSKTFATTKAGVETVLARRGAREGAGAKKLRELSAKPKSVVAQPLHPQSSGEVPGLQPKRVSRGGLKEVDANSDTRRRPLPAATGACGEQQQQQQICNADVNGAEWSTNPVEAMKTYQNSLRSLQPGATTEAAAAPADAEKKKKKIRSSDSAKVAFDKFIHRRDAAKAKHDEKFRQPKEWGTVCQVKEKAGKSLQTGRRPRATLPDMVM